MSNEDELWCPRRAETGIQYPGPDTWRDRPSLAGATASATPTCSYCGSLEPGRFLELVEAGWIVGPTDKDYKAYLDRPLTEDEIADRKRTWLDSTLAVAVRRVGEAAGKSPDEIAAELDRRWEHDRTLWATGNAEAKIYFQHLSVEQRYRFIELYITKAMTIGNPGYFYTPPFFCAFNRDG